MDALRSLIQPITHNLPGPIRDIGVGLIGEACYQAVVLDVDETNTECIKLGVSKGLGVAIVAASAVVKVPQIVNLVRSRSAAGVSFLSYLLETTAYLVSLAYNVRNGFPFSTYGETAFILVQNVAITLLVLHYSGRSVQAAVLAAVLATGTASLFSEAAVNTELLGYLQAGAGTLGVASKIPQILAIWLEGSTGQLSAFTVFNYLVGSLSRIFTTLQEVDDKLILYGFVAGFVLNAVLTAQMVYYWNAPAKKAAKAKKPASKKSAGKKPAGKKQ
ncbi:monosaccharide-p-dolichol utilization protein [Grosmannia clavigera kw1407]|uniref:Mannose-P-dolichol utilization defect 1 protein homolog n=1 Tax=Grosmannia clavigera (strain kw1407 / UAMH 11150) TaxID=655863 RepID=F0XT46_GROCL|nr:monosaccharide-p-dolichol utilization protein [Grosmannia clavigera kw1407]EFW99098.1 monosaccharide-p-dolichol utilization protein [Grosmannia clavigera kw1407]